MFNRYPSTLHVYHHFESKPCDKCGYISNSGYWDQNSFYAHLVHTINESSVLVDRLNKNGDIKVAKPDEL